MSTKLTPGMTVRVREDYPNGHFRTPVYIRGKTGTITKALGAYTNPEIAAYGLKGPKKEHYEVRFRQSDIWSDYAGPDHDTVDIDLMEHWLEPL
ncbi:MAG: hypothetical protein RLZ98_619 [Pseudomonadota bacterium]|jgi:nitrile hydratase